MKTAWFDENILPNSMINSNFSSLEKSEHFGSLEKCFYNIKDANNLIDLGCGAGEVSRIFKYDYTGADLPHIIEKVSKIKNPQNNYIIFDVEKNSMNFLKDYDIVLMNGFISEIPNWYMSLTKILLNAKKYIIIHRQDITQEKTSSFTYKTYGDLDTINNVINYSDFIRLFEMNNFKLLFQINSYPNNQTKNSFVFEKIND